MICVHNYLSVDKYTLAFNYDPGVLLNLEQVRILKHTVFSIEIDNIRKILF